MQTAINLIKSNIKMNNKQTHVPLQQCGNQFINARELSDRDKLRVALRREPVGPRRQLRAYVLADQRRLAPSHRSDCASIDLQHALLYIVRV